MKLTEKFRLTPRERAGRMAFVHLQPEDLVLLGSLRSQMEKQVDGNAAESGSQVGWAG